MELAIDNKNYKIKNGMAYTEDKICVYNLRICKIPMTVKNEEVLEYFTEFGEVLKLQLISKKKFNRNRQKSTKMGFVHFADAQVAANVLQHTHVLHSKRISLKACDSWHQPDAYKGTSSAEDPAPEVDQSGLCSDDDLGACGGSTTFQPSALNLLNLNDDCLALITKELDLRDQVSMARTCTRLSGVVQMCSKVAHKHVLLDELSNMTIWEIREFFLMCGSSVEIIEGEIPVKNRNRLIQLIARNCPNVSQIDFGGSMLKTSSLCELVGNYNMRNLTELKLAECVLTDNALLSIKNLRKLEKLTLSENYELTGKHLSKLTNLRELDIHGCGHIETQYFIDAVQSLKELHTLNIQRCVYLLGSAFEEMQKHCSKLEVLRMSCPEVTYNCIARLPALKRLEMAAGGDSVPPSFFKALSENKSSQLEHLKITARNCINSESARHISQLSNLKTLILSYNEDLTDDCLRRFGELENLEEIVLRNCAAVTNDGLLHLVRKCTKLRLINVQRCPDVNDQFIFDVIELLRERHLSLPLNHKQKPIVFHVLKTGISEFVMNNSKCQNTASLLLVSFSSPFNLYSLDEEDNMEIFDYLDDEDYDEFYDIDNESLDDDEVDFVADLDVNGEPYHMYDYSDMDDDEYHQAYNRFGRYAPANAE